MPQQLEGSGKVVGRIVRLRDDPGEVMLGSRVVRFGTLLVPLDSFRPVLFHSDPEEVGIPEIAGGGPASVFGGFAKKLDAKRDVLRNADTPNIGNAEIHFGAYQAASRGKLIPMNGACRILS